MSSRTRRARRLASVGALVPVLLVMGLSSEAGSLPDQASPTGDEHAHTHGPDGIDLDPRGRGHAGTAAAGPYAVDTAVSWSATQWDGSVFTTDQPDLTTLPTFHAVYVHPSDQPSRFKQFAAMFQADARDASKLLFDLYGRGIRFDERAGAAGARYLDITVVKSRHKARQLSGGNQFSLVSDELSRVFGDSNKKYVAWLDAGSQACGQGHLYQDTRRTAENYNERRTTAIVYRPYSASDASGGFCRGRTLRHELGHNMGALQQVAPHAFDGAHCSDSPEDTMCYTTATDGVDTGVAAFDYRNDDYWDPVAAGSSGRLAWWTVNLSRFVCPVGGDCTAANTPEF